MGLIVLGFFGTVWKVGLLLLGNCTVNGNGASAVAMLTFQTLVSSLPVRLPVVPGHSINLLPFFSLLCGVQ